MCSHPALVKIQSFSQRARRNITSNHLATELGIGEVAIDITAVEMWYPFIGISNLNCLEPTIIIFILIKVERGTHGTTTIHRMDPIFCPIWISPLQTLLTIGAAFIADEIFS